MLYPSVREVASSYHEEWTEADALAEQESIEDALLCSIVLPKPPRMTDVIQAVQSIGTLGRWADDA